MQGILLATALAMLVSLFGTPVVIDFFRARGIGQPIREDGPAAHFVKQGTPTMGGFVILAAATIGYLGAHMRLDGFSVQLLPLSRAGLLVLGSAWALGLIGAIDDIKKVRERRSMGLARRWRLLGQAVVGFGLAYGAMEWTGIAPRLSYAGADLIFLPQLPQIVFAVWILIMISGTSNAVNFTDGADGLASGASAMALFVFTIIGFWEFRHPDFYAPLMPPSPSGQLDIAITAAALLGACIGFLWWNAAPARIIMGDTGATALGGAMAALSVFTRTQFLLVVIGGLFVIEILSVILQIVAYRGFRGRRVFAMAPLHHHFELRGWAEFTVIVRFWLIAGLMAGLGLALFYMHFLGAGGLD